MVVLRRGSRALLFTIFAWPFPSLVIAQIVNRTIDDSFGDSQTGLQVTYLPAANWHNQSCTSCVIRPDVTKAFNKTYTAATYLQSLGSVNITMLFNGTAIYVFFILFNNEGSEVTLTLTNFTLDENQPQLFVHIPDVTTDSVEYDQLAFSKTNLTNAQHTLVIATSGDAHVYVNFDYAIYTHDDDAPLLPLTEDPGSTSTAATRTAAPQVTTASMTSTISTPASARAKFSNTNSKSSTVGLIAGGVVSAIALISFSIYFYLRRQRIKKSNAREDEGTFTPSLPLQSNPARDWREVVEEDMILSDMREQLRSLREENASLRRSARVQRLPNVPPPSYSTLGITSERYSPSPLAVASRLSEVKI